MTAGPPQDGAATPVTPAAAGARPAARPRLALGLVLLASASFAALNASVKAVVPQVGLAPPILFRGLLALAACVAYARVAGVSLRPRGLVPLAVRCVAGCAAIATFYRAFAPGGTDLATASMLLKTSPLWVSLLAPAIVLERPGPRTWLGLVMGLCGVAAVHAGTFGGERLGVLLSLAAGVLSAVAYLSLRRLASTDPPHTVVAVFSAALVVVSLPLCGPALEAAPSWPAGTWGLLLLGGVLGTAGQLFLTAAYRYGSAAEVTVGGLAEIAMALALSVWLFGDEPHPAKVAGGLLALLAGLVAASGEGPRATGVRAE